MSTKTNKLSQELNNLQDNVIGLFKISRLDKTWLVINNDNGYLTCVKLGELGSMTTLYIDHEEGYLKMFDDGKSLGDLKNDPYKLDKTYTEFLNS